VLVIKYLLLWTVTGKEVPMLIVYISALAQWFKHPPKRISIRLSLVVKVIR
jgi:hypothetical protein